MAVLATEPLSMRDVCLAHIPDISIDTETLTGVSLAIGAVLGKATVGAVPTTGAAGTNTGNGTCTSVTGATQVKPGVYTATCVLAATNGGLFSVRSPKGYALGIARVGAAYTSPEINFTLNDGSTDYAVGDSFTVTVPAGSGKVVALDLSAVNGAAVASGILLDATDASAADKTVPVLERMAVIDPVNLVWPSGATTAQKNTALAELLVNGVVAKTTV